MIFFQERLWRTTKYENIYIKHYQNIDEARQGLAEYFDFYNNKRFHSSLNYLVPAQVYFQSKNRNRENQIILPNLIKKRPRRIPYKALLKEKR